MANPYGINVKVQTVPTDNRRAWLADDNETIIVNSAHKDYLTIEDRGRWRANPIAFYSCVMSLLALMNSNRSKISTKSEYAEKAMLVLAGFIITQFKMKRR
jgi:hypothetical protein